MDRRTFLQLLSAGTAAPFVLGARTAFAAIPLKVVIVGGGMAGTTAARYLRLWASIYGVNARVTLVDANPAYVSCIMSNKVLTGETTLSALTYSYAKVSTAGVTVLTGTVSSVDPTARQVHLAGGRVLDYDRLILAPGIDFDYATIAISATGLSQAEALAAVPHAWKAGPQTTALRQQLVDLTDGNPVVMTIPPSPYRCPPGPYERACAIAEWLKRNRPKSKLIVLDANPKIQAEPINFGRAFTETYRTVIDYRPGVTVTSVTFTAARMKAKTVKAIGTGGIELTFNAEVVNVIPPQRAGQIVRDTLGSAGLASGRWALVDETTYESRAVPRVHVIGDAISSRQPKAGHIGNQEAKICADAILRLAAGQQPYANPVSNSACFTPITAKTATWLTAVYRMAPDVDPATGQPTGTRSMQMVSGNPVGVPSESPGTPSSANYEAMTKWFRSLMVDSFG
jgi:sulfide dehydrogenase [flavocytochrome c] flavoprotein subunit